MDERSLGDGGFMLSSATWSFLLVFELDDSIFGYVGDTTGSEQ